MVHDQNGDRVFIREGSELWLQPSSNAQRRFDHSLHRQNRNGTQAARATKIGKSVEDSSE